jgi:hypothetical protein
MNDVVVLGAGLSGLLAGIKLDATVYSKAETTYADSYIFLHYNDVNRMMLYELGYSKNDVGPENRIRTKIGWNYKDKYYNSPTIKMLKEYQEKCYGQLERTATMTYNNHLDIYNMNYSDVIKRAKEKLGDKLINDEATKINLKNRTIELKSGNMQYYDYLISTIPLEVFCKLSGIKLDLGSSKHLFIYETDYVVPEGIVNILIADADKPTTRYVQNIVAKKCFEERLEAYGGRNPIAWIKAGKINMTEQQRAVKDATLRTLEKIGVFMCGRFSEFDSHKNSEDSYMRCNEIARRLKNGE